MAQCRLIRSTPTTPAPATNAFAPCTRVTNTSPISSFTATSEHSWALNLLPHHLLHQLLLASRPKQLLTRAYRATPIVATTTRVSTTDQFVAQTQHQLSKSSAKAYTFALFDRYACSLSPLPAGFTSTDVSLHQRNILPDPSLFEDDQAHGSLSLVSFVVPPQPDAKLCVEKGTHRT
ncbi:hypothetical protein PtB15_9B351 [Puccinia triticina]|nr:hypothetical protein PtB15_9B351 [Puccinia triticina]